MRVSQCLIPLILAVNSPVHVKRGFISINNVLNHSQKILILSKSRGRSSCWVFTLKGTIFKFLSILRNADLDNPVGFLRADILGLFSIVAWTKCIFSGVVTVTLLLNYLYSGWVLNPSPEIFLIIAWMLDFDGEFLLGKRCANCSWTCW